MTADISKIRDERLTEDEKMELIADYLEGGGGGGSSSKLRVKVNINYTPTAKSEVIYASESSGTGYYEAGAQYISFQDEKGDPIDTDTIKDNIIKGNIEFIGMDHLGDIAIFSGESVTLIPSGAQFSSIPTGTMYVEDMTYMAVGQLQGSSPADMLTAAVTITGGVLGAIVGVTLQ